MNTADRFTLLLPLFLCCLSLSPGSAAQTLSDPRVDAYNCRIGTQTFAGRYQFTTNTLLVETARAIRELGSDVLKMTLEQDYPRQYRIQLGRNITNLVTLARDEPSCRTVLDMPFRHFLLWAYAFTPFGWGDGLSASERQVEYRQMYDLARHLLERYSGTGKTFHLGHWEGDWHLLGGFDPTGNPGAQRVQGMIDWLNARQQAVDDAKRDVPHHDVEIFHFTEVNLVRDAMSGNPKVNQRVINQVVPRVPQLDFVSYSAYDVQDQDAATVHATLDYIASQIPTAKAASIAGPRLWIGEYGWGFEDGALVERLSRKLMRNVLTWDAGPRFVLFWEIYGNEAGSGFSLINSAGLRTPSYALHHRFLNAARLEVARFLQDRGRLPGDREFTEMMSPILERPLPEPVALVVRHDGVGAVDDRSSVVGASLTQGIYGDDPATVWLHYGRWDGGTNAADWGSSMRVALNQRWGSVPYRVTLENLLPDTSYHYRFQATNAGSSAWALRTGQFRTGRAGGEGPSWRTRIDVGPLGADRDLEDFPVLVRLGAHIPGFHYRQFLLPVGGDLRFRDASGELTLPFEIDEWNPEGVSTAWVRVPRIRSEGGAQIWATWGDSRATSLPEASTDGSVWANDHLVVYHLSESRLPFADAGRRHPASRGVAPASAQGIIGKGVRLDGLGSYLDAGVIDLGETFTLSAWIQLSPAATDIQTVWASKKGGWDSPGFSLVIDSWQTKDRQLLLENAGVGGAAIAFSPVAAVSHGAWHHVAASIHRAEGTARLYIDGRDVTVAGDVRTDMANRNPVHLGRFVEGPYFFTGSMDEARIESTARSAHWIRAAWLNVVSNDLYVAASGVSFRPPRLSHARAVDGLALEWRDSGTESTTTLHTATRLGPDSVWAPVAAQPTLVNGAWRLTMPVEGETHRYFQLRTVAPGSSDQRTGAVNR